MKRIYPINQAEAICMPLFDVNLSNLNQFIFTEQDETNGCFSQSWDCCVIDSGAQDFKLIWNGVIELEQYNAIRFFINFPSYVSLDGYATVNGRREILFKNVIGSTAPIEPTSAALVDKNHSAQITELELHFYCKNNNANRHVVNLYWIGLLAVEKEPLIEQQLPVYTQDSWEGLINKNGNPGINNNVFFSEQQLIQMKARLSEEMFRRPANELKQQASVWEGFQPEKEIREYVPVIEHLYRYTRVRDRNRTVLEQPIITLAIAGYLFDNYKWSEVAARMILSVASTPNWFEGPQGCVEGSTWHHVCFMEDHYMSAIVIALGFMGNIFTKRGMIKVMAAVEKAWHRVNMVCEEKGYRWYMNQGIVGNRGRMAGACCLFKNSDKYEKYIEQSYIDHTTIVNNYLNDEGHCTEGEYYQYSFYGSVQLWLAYANYKNVDIRSVLPDRFIKSIKYAEAVMSCNNGLGYALPIGASKYQPYNTLLLAFFASVCGWDKAYAYLGERVREKSNNATGQDLLMLLRFMPSDQPVLKKNSNRLITFAKGGLVSYQFEKKYAGKLLFLCERNPMTGHYHEDRGSVVLEFNRQILLTDLGTTNYSNPLTSLMTRVEYHNVAYPVGLKMNIANPKALTSANEAGVGCTTIVSEDDFTYPGPELESVCETEHGVKFCANMRPLYGEQVMSAKRFGALELDDSGGILTLNDNWMFNGEYSLSINFLSYCSWQLGDCFAKTIIGGSEMIINFSEQNNLDFNLEQDPSMIDSCLNKVYTLRVRTKCVDCIKFCSQIIFRHLDD